MEALMTALGRERSRALPAIRVPLPAFRLRAPSFRRRDKLDGGRVTRAEIQRLFARELNNLLADYKYRAVD